MRTATLALCLALLGCFHTDAPPPVAPEPRPAPSPEPPRPPGPEPTPEPAPEPVSPHAELCAAYCAHVRGIDPDDPCDAVRPSPGGIECEQRCEATLDAEVFPLDVECRMKQSSCEALEFCEQ